MTSATEAVEPWADLHTARRAMAVLHDVTPDVTHVVFDGSVPSAWPAAAREAGYAEEGGERGATAVVFVDPAALPGDADGAADMVRRLGARGATVVLATVSPAATHGQGRWPAFWADPFASAGWTFLDAIRAALWDDARVPLDCKEGLLLFVEGDRPAGASPALAMVHPHRAVELTMATEARFRSMLAQRVEQQSLWDSLVRDIAARHDQLQLRLDLIGGRLGLLQDRLFLVTAPAPPLPVEPMWRTVAKRVLRRPTSVVADPPPDRGVWELFEPGFYRLQVPDAGPDPLRHYLDVGEAQGLRPNPWFDPAFYLAQNEDVAAAGVGAFDHYCRYGGFEGRVASAEFDTAYYLATNPDVRAAGVHPMLHFMLVGRWEGRRPAPPS